MFSVDVEKFLEDAAASLETTFSATFEFSAIDEEVIQKISDMTEGFTALRSNSSSLCDKENQTMTRTNTKGKVLTFLLPIVSKLSSETNDYQVQEVCAHYNQFYCSLCSFCVLTFDASMFFLKFSVLRFPEVAIT